jgi:hypothetical protein
MYDTRDQVEQFEGTPEVALEKGLSGLQQAASELGANTLAVVVAEPASIEIVYPKARQVQCDAGARHTLTSSSGALAANTSVAGFLTSEVTPDASSYLIFPWSVSSRAVIIVFGFQGPLPPHTSVPGHLVDTLSLAAFAAWSVKEANRLRKELRLLNHQLANRKLVERAKSKLQAERGLTEQEAYELLRKMSRQRRITLAQTAEDLVCAARCP